MYRRSRSAVLQQLSRRPCDEFANNQQLSRGLRLEQFLHGSRCFHKQFDKIESWQFRAGPYRQGQIVVVAGSLDERGVTIVGEDSSGIARGGSCYARISSFEQNIRNLFGKNGAF